MGEATMNQKSPVQSPFFRVDKGVATNVALPDGIFDQSIWNDGLFPVSEDDNLSHYDWIFNPPHYNWEMSTEEPFSQFNSWPAYQYSYGIEQEHTIDPGATINLSWTSTGPNETEMSETLGQPTAKDISQVVTPLSNHEEDEIGNMDSPSSSSCDADSDSDYVPTPSRPAVGDTNAKRRYHPYHRQSRNYRAKKGREYQPELTEEEEEDHTGSRVPPTTTAYCDSNPATIKEQLSLLLQRLRERGLSCSPHNPRLLCPVIDCPLGGWNILLHGPNPAASRRKKGNFLSANEVVRHVTSLHAPDEDLVCLYPGCKEQERLNRRSERGGNGYFYRVDVFRTHLKKYPAHRQYIPEELRARRKLFPRATTTEE